MSRPIAALMYDFDKTLCTKDMHYEEDGESFIVEPENHTVGGDSRTRILVTILEFFHIFCVYFTQR